MKTRDWLMVAVSAMTSASVWALSPLLAGQREPWDADGYFYVVALVVAGSVAGLLAHGRSGRITSALLSVS